MSKRMFVEDSICSHLHKDAPENAKCEDCYSKLGNSEKDSVKLDGSLSQTENPDMTNVSNDFKIGLKEGYNLALDDMKKKFSKLGLFALFPKLDEEIEGLKRK